LRTQKQQLETEYEKARQRVETLVRSVATGILQDSPDADAIELVLFERSIPLPQDVVDGSRLTDPRYLSDPLPIGKFTRSELSADKTFTNAAGQGRADAMEELP
jgi:hypothetical protein